MDRSLRAAGIVGTSGRAGAPAVPLIVPLVVALAWIAAVAAQIGGGATAVHHDSLIERGEFPLWVAVVVFLAAWLVMIAAMMLPSSLPMIRHFNGVLMRQGRPRSQLATFLGGYVLVWSIFGVLALGGDLFLHRIVDRTSWLEARPWLIGGTIVALAGAFQFTSLKNRCLTQCRQPFAYLVHKRLRGVDGAFRLGFGHGLFCLGCCWALMLLMFAAGAANLVWMAALAGVMIYEKVGRRGDSAAPLVGIALLAWAVLVLAHPAWLPRPLAGFA